MRVLILGGGNFVGRALVEAALARGHRVTTFTRSTLPPGAAEGTIQTLHGDRTTEEGLRQLANHDWDAVLDTWSGAPRVVHASVSALRDRVPYYSYVSSCSVYREPTPAGFDESHPAVDGLVTADLTDYSADKRGAELAVLDGYGEDRSLLARAGLILGPYEDQGRLPWWLRRIADAGDVLAPGSPDVALQYVDARDLARWMVECAERRSAGVFNAASEPGHTTMGKLLAACQAATASAAKLIWVDHEFLLAHRIRPWTQLPIWIPPGPSYDAIHRIDTRRAAGAGLRCRSITETVNATWRWQSARFIDGGTHSVPTDREAPGLAPETEAAVLAAWAYR